MGPVRIRYYGLMWLTKPTYLVLQSIALFLCVVLMALGFFAALFADLAGTVLSLQADFLANAGLFTFVLFLLVLVIESIEMYVMLRKFTRAEADLQAKLAALDVIEPAPSAPSSTALQLPSNPSPPNTNIQP